MLSDGGVIARAFRVRQQRSAGQSRYLKGTEGAWLGAWYRKPREESVSALPVVGVGEPGRFVRAQRVMQSMTPRAKKDGDGSPSERAIAQLRTRSHSRRDQVGRALSQELLGSGLGSASMPLSMRGGLAPGW